MRFGRMKKYILLMIAASLQAVLYCGPVSALSLSGVVAYPVPYNPNTQLMKIDSPSPIPVSKVTIEIFDINGDGVFKRDFTSFPANWNGRNNSGRKVKPGMYIVKVTAEATDGGFARKILRILVDY